MFIVYYNLLSTYVARRQELVLKRLRTGEASDATVLAAAAVPALAIAAVMTVLMTVLAIVLMDLPLPEPPGSPRARSSWSRSPCSPRTAPAPSRRRA